MRLPLHSACAAFLLVLGASAAWAQATTPVQQQAANAAALGQGQVPAPAAPTPQGAIQALSSPDGAPVAASPAAVPAAGATATGAAPATAVAADGAAHPGIIPGVSPSTAPPPESKDDVHDRFKRSLFFSSEELIQISQASKGIVQVAGGTENIGKPIPQVRTITLTGVLYKSPEDWIIWLNGQKLNRKNLLKEIYDIKVEQDLVHLKWYDIGADKVLNITMRPHQKYDIVTGLMLPVPPGE